jgi:hypothetical protein
MSDDPDQSRWFGMMASLIGALTGQRELSDEDRRTVAVWVVDHVDVPEFRELMIQVVATQIIDTSEFREQVAEAIRRRFRTDDEGPEPATRG